MTDTSVLSDREIEILQLVATGLTNREIAQALTISPNTVKVHLRNIFEKINVSSRTEATMFGIKHGIVDVPGSEDDENQSASFTMLQNSSWVFMTILLVIVVLAAIGGNVIFTSPTPTPIALSDLPDRWQEVAPMPEPRSGMAAVTYNGNIYVIAGDGLEGVSDSVLRYITTENRWEQLSEKPTSVADVEGVLIGEKIYIPGGRLPDGQNTDILEVYDPRLDTWERKASLPVKISGYALADFEGQIYLFGGWDGEKALDIVLSYDRLEDRWESVASMPTARVFAGAAPAAGRIYIIGGRDGEKELDTNESYSPTRDVQGGEAWQIETPLPSTGYGIGVESVGDMVFIIGENGVWQYALGSDTWNYDESEIPFDSLDKFGFSLLESYIFVIGGKDSNDKKMNTVYRYQAIYSFVLPIIRN